VDNHYMYGKANPITFIDPTGHNAQQGLSYGFGGGFTVLGIIGAIFSAPTGGASLTLSAGAGIAAGATTALSGIALMGSQGALDSGNKEAAKALQYTSLGLGAIALVEAGVAVAPAIYARFFTGAVSQATSLVDNTAIRLARLYTAGSASIESSIASVSSMVQETAAEDITGAVNSSISSSSDSQATVISTASSVDSSSSIFMASSRSLPESAYDAASESSSIASRAASPLNASEPERAIYFAQCTVVAETFAAPSQPSSQIANTPIIPGSFIYGETLTMDLLRTNAAFTETNLDEASDVSTLLEVGHPNFEHSYLASETE
jgi:hypothetical protein